MRAFADSHKDKVTSPHTQHYAETGSLWQADGGVNTDRPATSRGRYEFKQYSFLAVLGCLAVTGGECSVLQRQFLSVLQTDQVDAYEPNTCGGNVLLW